MNHRLMTSLLLSAGLILGGCAGTDTTADRERMERERDYQRDSAREASDRMDEALRRDR